MQKQAAIAWLIYIALVFGALAVGFVYLLPDFLEIVGIEMDGEAELLDIIIIFSVGSLTLISSIGAVAVTWLLSLRIFFGKKVAKAIFHSGPTTKLDRAVFGKLVD